MEVTRVVFTALCLLLWFSRIISSSSEREDQVCGERDTTSNTVQQGQVVKNPLAWPWLAAVFVKNESTLKFVCGGSLISRNLVLTAAHCFIGRGYNYKRRQLLVYLGRHTLHDWGDFDISKAKNVKKVYRHNTYLASGSNKQGDIGILVLENPVKFTNRIRPVCLPSAGDSHEIASKIGSVVGWGSDHLEKEITSEPRFTNLLIVTNEECIATSQTVNYELTDFAFCAGFRNGSTTCHGDSGGGMYLKHNSSDGREKWTVIGIISQSVVDLYSFCRADLFSKLTKVSKYLSWIHEIKLQHPVHDDDEVIIEENFKRDVLEICKPAVQQVENYFDENIIALKHQIQKLRHEKEALAAEYKFKLILDSRSNENVNLTSLNELIPYLPADIKDMMLEAEFLYEDYDKDVLLFAVNKTLLTFKYLAVKGARVNAEDEYKRTPIYLAALWEKKENFQYLLNFAVDINAKNSDGNTLLHIAVQNNDTNVINHLKEAGVNINAKDEKGDTPLHIAAKLGNLDVINSLLEDTSIEIDITNNRDRTPLMLAANKGHLNIVKVLVEKYNADLNVRDKNGRNALYEASFWTRLDVVQYIIEVKEGDINYKDNFEISLLHLAAVKNHIALLKYLLNKGAKVNIQNINGNTPLHLASHSGHLEVVTLLVDNVRTFIQIKNNAGDTPVKLAERYNRKEILKVFRKTPLSRIESLLEAVKNGNLKEVTYLIETTDVSSKSLEEDTALHIAAKYGHLNITQLLIKAGASINVRNILGRTPFIVACLEGHLNIVKYFVENYKLNIEERDNQHKTALYEATFYDHFEVIKYLITVCDADVNIMDDINNTLLHVAAIHNHLRVMEYLVSNKKLTVINAQNSNLNTPLHNAVIFGNLRIVNFLVLEAKANKNIKNQLDRTPLQEAVLRNKTGIVCILMKNEITC